MNRSQILVCLLFSIAFFRYDESVTPCIHVAWKVVVKASTRKQNIRYHGSSESNHMFTHKSHKLDQFVNQSIVLSNTLLVGLTNLPVALADQTNSYSRQ
jgi:hypothetical protein